MAIISVDLLAGQETIINEANAQPGDFINLNLIGSGTLVIDGVNVVLNNIVGIGALSSPRFAAQNGGTLTIDQGLLAAGVLTAPIFEVRGDGTLRLDASDLSVGLTETLLNSFSVVYTGAGATGVFSYSPPAVSLLALGPQTFRVSGMQETDVFAIDGRTNLRIDAAALGIPPVRNPEDAYDDASGIFRLISPGTILLGETVRVEIPMTREEFDLYLADPSRYLSGSSFTFPGVLPVICFGRGTMILTATGETAVESLRVGDRVVTRDHGLQLIRWIGARRLDAIDFAAQPRLRPIRIKAGALGPGFPAADLVLSPQHRILVRSKIAHRMFGVDEVLVAAKQLLAMDGIEVACDLDSVEYFHILFDQHEIIRSNGAETESLFTGPQALRGLGRQALVEVQALFPQLFDVNYVAISARGFATGGKARQLAARHIRNGVALASPDKQRR